MNLLALLTDGIGAKGGIARYNSALLAALSKSSAVAGVIALPRFGSLTDATCPAKVSQLPAVSSSAAWATRATRLAATNSFDTIFCGHINAAPFAAFLARLTGRRLWIQAHGIEAWDARTGPYRRALASAGLITAVSRHTRARLLAWSDTDANRVRVLPNTFSPMAEAAMDDGQSRSAALISRHNLPGARVILTVGRLAASERYKGHDRIIDVLPDVIRRVPTARYLVVGSGDDSARLRDLARRQDVAGQTIFAGEASAADLPGYFALANVFAMPSTGEGFGIVFLEAASCGCAVIAGNRDGSADALADGAIGTLIDPDDRAALVDALVAGLENRLPVAPGAGTRFAFENFTNHVDELVRHHL